MAARSTGGSGRIYGPETWKTIGGVELSHWDLWFIVAIREHPWGKRGLVEGLKAQARSFVGDHGLEAKLAHLLDLETRLLAAGVTHDEVLAEAVIDKRLLRKVQDKVPGPYASNLTPAMSRTPSSVLYGRAMAGYWSRFPVDPSKHESAFAQAHGPTETYIDYKWTWFIVEQLESAWEIALLAATTPAETLAAHRAMMTAMEELAGHVDDSGGDTEPLSERVLDAYLAIVWESGIEPEIALRDAIEFGIWEAFCLFGEMERFLVAVSAEHHGLAIRMFEETTAELHINGLRGKHGQALSMWARFLVAHGLFDKFERLAIRIGSDFATPIVILTNAAWASGRKDIARAVFAAVNRPGPCREALRKECVKLTGEEPGPCPPLGTLGTRSSG